MPHIGRCLCLFLKDPLFLLLLDLPVSILSLEEVFRLKSTMFVPEHRLMSLVSFELFYSSVGSVLFVHDVLKLLSIGVTTEKVLTHSHHFRVF
jgi:hypothetical protein